MLIHLLLAAGAGTRMGGNKGVLPLGGRPILSRLLDAFEASRLDRAIVVSGAEAPAVEALCTRPRVDVVRNVRWPEGQTSSLQTALGVLPRDATAFLIHPVDHALVDARVLDALASAFVALPQERRESAILRPVFEGGYGHPVLYALRYAAEFLALRPEQSARIVYRRRIDAVLPVTVADDRSMFDLDTPEDLARAERRLRVL